MTPESNPKTTESTTEQTRKKTTWVVVATEKQKEEICKRLDKLAGFVTQQAKDTHGVTAVVSRVDVLLLGLQHAIEIMDPSRFKKGIKK